MDGSSLPLPLWFVAIRAVVANPKIETTDLAGMQKIGRYATARGLIVKIIGAVSSTYRSAGLAGLDTPTGGLAELGARRNSFLRNELPVDDAIVWPTCSSPQD
jgi:hypothetical protein